MKYTFILTVLAVSGLIFTGCHPCCQSGTCGSASTAENSSDKDASPAPVVVEEKVTEEVIVEQPSEPATPESSKEAKELDDLAAPEAPTTPDLIEQAEQDTIKDEAKPEAKPEPDTVKDKAKPEVETSSTMTSSDQRMAMPGTNDQWRPETADSVDWIAKEQRSHFLLKPADNSALLEGGQKAGDTYKNFTKQDLVVWERETERMVTEGSRIFHSADELGSTIAVSCDMCHPDGSNTHPETYPKYQVQLGRAALLRDMINWCLENPCRGKPLSGDDPKMRALEAYIQAMRAGTEMQYGKH